MQKAAQFLFDCRCVALPNYADDRGIQSREWQGHWPAMEKDEGFNVGGVGRQAILEW
jgi:hypothetical protein